MSLIQNTSLSKCQEMVKDREDCVLQSTGLQESDTNTRLKIDNRRQLDDQREGLCSWLWTVLGGQASSCPSLESALGRGCLPQRARGQVAGKLPMLSWDVRPSTAALTSSQSDDSRAGIPTRMEEVDPCWADSCGLGSPGHRRISGGMPSLDFHP